MTQTLRAFIAIELPAETAQGLAAIQTRLQSQRLNLRWVRPANIHLTLKFLGDIATDATDGIITAMEISAARTQPFELTLQGLGVFPGLRRPRVFWTGLTGALEQLQDAHRRLEDALAERGIPREGRSFKGHVTLGRFKGAEDPSRLAMAIEQEGMFAPLPLAVREMVLFQSRLQATGAEYTRLARCSLSQMV
jgi:2'-5' RNA ligase